MLNCLDLTVDGDLADFLGINIDRKDDHGMIHLTQPHLIESIIKYLHIPDNPADLTYGTDPDDNDQDEPPPDPNDSNDHDRPFPTNVFHKRQVNHTDLQDNSSNPSTVEHLVATTL